MVGRTVFRSCLIVAALLGARSVSADPITFTGNVANDFNPATNPGVVVITDSLHQNDPAHIAQPAWMTSEGLVSGWNIKDVRLDYNAATDTMYVGVNTYGVAGNVYGGGTPPAGTAEPRAATRRTSAATRRWLSDLPRSTGTFSTLQSPHARDRRGRFRRQNTDRDRVSTDSPSRSMRVARAPAPSTW